MGKPDKPKPVWDALREENVVPFEEPLCPCDICEYDIHYRENCKEYCQLYKNWKKYMDKMEKLGVYE